MYHLVKSQPLLTLYLRVWNDFLLNSYHFLKHHSRNVLVKWLTLLLRIREVPDSDLDLETGYPY
jgi:hypothetical protein